MRLPVTDKKDIDIPVNTSYSVKVDESTPFTPEESKILACLDATPKAMDDVIAQLDMPAGDVLKLITKLSLKGNVIIHPGKLVSKSRGR